MNNATETNGTLKCTRRLLAESTVEYRHINHKRWCLQENHQDKCACVRAREHTQWRYIQPEQEDLKQCVQRQDSCGRYLQRLWKQFIIFSF